MMLALQEGRLSTWNKFPVNLMKPNENKGKGFYCSQLAGVRYQFLIQLYLADMVYARFPYAPLLEEFMGRSLVTNRHQTS